MPLGQRSVPNHGAILLKALGGGIRVLWTHMPSLFVLFIGKFLASKNIQDNSYAYSNNVTITPFSDS